MALWALAALIAVGTSYAISIPSAQGDKIPLNRQETQRTIASPPGLGFTLAETVVASPVSEPAINMPASENLEVARPTAQDAVGGSYNPSSNPQPEVQNVPVGPSVFPSAPVLSPLARGVPSLPSSKPVTALIVDRGVPRPIGNLRPNSTSVSTAGQNAFDTLALEQPNPSPTVLRAGSSISAVLETGIDTSEPGEVRAMVNEHVAASTSTQVLIPKGARLIGEYQGSSSDRSKRAIVNWTRLILPDGRQVRFDFPGADKSGASGIPGKVHSNSLGRLLGGVLQSALNVVTLRAANAGRNDSILVAIPAGATGSAQALVPQSTTQRRITVRAGALINVLVKQDIDFARTEAN